ncbi:anthranilate synthase component I [soil metagenome]
MITKDEFYELANQGYNRIPLVREMLADLDTPVSAFVKLVNGPYSYLFESVQGGENWGRYSIIGLPCHTIIRIRDHIIKIIKDNEIIEEVTTADPLAWVEEFKARLHVATLPNLPPFTGGLVGYFGFDTVRYIEPRLGPCPNQDPLGNPDILLMVSEEIAVFDNLSNKLYLILQVNPESPLAYEKAEQHLEELTRRLRKPVSLPLVAHQVPSEVTEENFISNTSRENYDQSIQQIQDYIHAGEVMQVVYSQRWRIPYHASPYALYRALRCMNPAPYMYYLDLDKLYIVGSSPEILVRLTDNQVTVRPIAGTRQRGKTVAEDQALEKELINDPKEIAEHLMLIDLGRNDIGKVSKIGSVQVVEQMIVERYSQVMHMVSEVVGELREGLSAMDVLRATFPAGTLTGAPKVRAMQIIDELETLRRGIYGGAVGYLGWSGNLDTAIAIRTAVIKDGFLHIQAGGGIVANSTAEGEWEESRRKARALFRAVQMAEGGF